MAKLLPEYQKSQLQPDIIDLLRNEVVSLCQQKYQSVSDIEIDGIICISILDSKEEQVVKIHTTLKSVFADNTRKLRTRQGGVGALHCSVKGYQENTNSLGELLKDTNATSHQESSSTVKQQETGNSIKRKRKQSRPRTTMCQNNKEATLKLLNLTKFDCENLEINEDKSEESPCPGNVVIKVEPLDLHYGSAKATHPPLNKHVSIVMDKKASDIKSVGVKTDSVGSYISHIIDRELEEASGGISKSNMQLKPNIDIENKYHTKHKSSASHDCCSGEKTDKDCAIQDSYENEDIEIKVERVDDDSDYGATNNDSADNSASPVNTGDYFSCDWSGSGDNSEGEFRKMVLMKDTSVDLRSKVQQQSDPHERSWIDMVKDNVSKYQAALIRSNQKKKSNMNTFSECEKNMSSNSDMIPMEAQKSQHCLQLNFKNADHLRAILEQPMLLSQKNVSDTDNLDGDRYIRSQSLPQNFSSKNSLDASTLVSLPIVKIEFDTDDAEYGKLPAKSDVPTDSNAIVIPDGNKTRLSNAGNSVFKPQQGRLESRYPALFNQLQQTGMCAVDQSDSLVNRLPFISFQEIFSPSNSGQSVPRLSETTTMQLLAQARVNPYPSKEKGSWQKKRRWNWKNRRVKPRDENGQIISHIPVYPEEDIVSKGLGVNMSTRKTFSKRRQKQSSEEVDVEWTPDCDNVPDEESMSDNKDTEGKTKIRTRLSCGKKPRINFAELEDSEFEIEEDDENCRQQSHEALELISAYCRNNCGRKFFSAAEVQAHEEECLRGTNATVGNQEYKCSLCGLDFNQEYRWHYHMIKGHGIAEDRVQMFR